jgi:hypothetical protein
MIKLNCQKEKKHKGKGYSHELPFPLCYIKRLSKFQENTPYVS